MTLRLYAPTQEYISVPVSASGLDISTDPVELAFMQDVEPTDADWVAADWVAGAARVLIGAAGVVLLPGTYTVWVRITDNPEVPVLQAGELVIV